MSGALQVMLGGAPPLDLYFEYNALLLPGNGTNGAQNNTFLDSSTNAFTITRAGNTTQGTFSPFSQTGWGNHFDGTGDFLSTPGNVSAFDFTSTKTLTFECWAYFTGFPDNATVFDIAESNPFRIVCNSGQITWQATAAATTVVSANVTVPTNTWNHIACVRDVDAVSIYLNGSRVASATYSSNWVSSGATAYVGCNRGNTWFVQGYLSNVRLVKGTAVYSGATITVPTSPLTAITNTSLLTCQSNRFRDESTNNLVMTRNGDVSVQSFSPFNPTAAWSASTNGGSGYYDGSGDWLTVNGNTAFAFSGEYTVECWIYPLVQYTSSSGYVGFVCMLNNPSGFILFIDGVNGITLGAYGVANQIQTLTYPTARMWNHLAVSRNASNVTSVFLNGTRIGTGTFSTSYTSTSGNNLEIGTFATSAGPFTGYMSGVRLVKGTAVYDPAQTSITVPTAPLTAIVNTSLLLNYTNAGIYDATSKNDLETVGNAQISTTQFKFGGSSMAFDGTNDNIIIPSSPNLDFGTGNFTIELWVNFSALSTNRVLLDKWVSGNVNSWQLYWRSIGTSIAFLVGSSTVLLQDPSTSRITTNTWYHIAVTRSGTTNRLFIDGTQVASATDSTNLTNTIRLCIGEQLSTLTNDLNGYINDIRITKGVARYTANFTPPGSPFPLS